MPASIIETVLIFFILFFISSSIILFFSSYQNYFLKKIDKEILDINSKTFRLCLNSLLENSTILCRFPEEVKIYGNKRYVLISYKNLIEKIKVENVKGLGVKIFYIYNSNGTYYIV